MSTGGNNYQDFLVITLLHYTNLNALHGTHEHYTHLTVTSQYLLLSILYDYNIKQNVNVSASDGGWKHLWVIEIMRVLGQIISVSPHYFLDRELM